MRTKLALAATAAMAAGLTIATPAAAQDYRYNGYNNAPYGNAYGYNRGGGQALHSQVEEIKRDIYHFGRSGALTGREANKLTKRANDLHQRIQRASYNGFGVDHREYRSIQERIANLQRQVGHDLRDRGNGRDDAKWKRYRGWGGQRGYGRY